MVFLTTFVLFAKLKARFLDSLTKNLQENANLCIQKSYWFCARALFQKFVSPHTNSSGGKGLKRRTGSDTEHHGARAKRRNSSITVHIPIDTGAPFFFLRFQSDLRPGPPVMYRATCREAQRDFAQRHSPREGSIVCRQLHVLMRQRNPAT